MAGKSGCSGLSGRTWREREGFTVEEPREGTKKGADPKVGPFLAPEGWEMEVGQLSPFWRRSHRSFILSMKPA